MPPAPTMATFSLAAPRSTACCCAVSASRMVSKVCSCGAAVVVRSCTSRIRSGKYVSSTSEQSMYSHALLVDQEQMVAAVATRDVDVLAQLDVALGAEDHQPAVAPGRQPGRGVPVDPDVALGVVAAEQQVAEVLQTGLVRVGEVPDRAGDHLGRPGAGEPEELVDLVRGDVDQDSAVPALVVEPVRPAGAAAEVGPVADPVRTEAEWSGRRCRSARRGPVRRP